MDGIRNKYVTCYVNQLSTFCSGESQALWYHNSMKCPNCFNRKIAVYEASGFTSKDSPIKECSCGHVWRIVREGRKHRIDVIKQGVKQEEAKAGKPKE